MSFLLLVLAHSGHIWHPRLCGRTPRSAVGETGMVQHDAPVHPLDREFGTDRGKARLPAARTGHGLVVRVVRRVVGVVRHLAAQAADAELTRVCTPIEVRSALLEQRPLT